MFNDLVTWQYMITLMTWLLGNTNCHIALGLVAQASKSGMFGSHVHGLLLPHDAYLLNTQNMTFPRYLFQPF